MFIGSFVRIRSVSYIIGGKTLLTLNLYVIYKKIIQGTNRLA